MKVSSKKAKEYSEQLVSVFKALELKSSKETKMSFNSFLTYFHKVAKITNFVAFQQESEEIKQSTKEKTFEILRGVYFWCVIVFSCLWILSLFSSMALKIGDLKEVSAILSNIINSFLAVAKAVTFTLKKKKIWKVLSTIKANFPKTQDQKTKYKTKCYLKFFNKFQAIYIIAFLFFVTSSGFEPIVHSIQNGGRRFPLEFWTPFDAYKPGVFEPVYAVLFFLAITVLSLSIASNLLLFAIIFLITKEFEILKEDFLSLLDFPESERKKELRLLIDVHDCLTKVIVDIENLVSPIFLYNLIQSSVLICLISFQISTATEYMQYFIYGLYLTAVSTKIFFHCFCGQRVIDSSLSISEAIYDIEWYKIDDLQLRKDLSFVMLRAQKFSKLTAVKFAVVSLERFAFVLSSSLSYFALLRSVWRSK